VTISSRRRGTIPNVDPKLLHNNGGPTPTIAPLSVIPARDAISNSNCHDLDHNPVTTDQRQFKRPFGPGCDIGAFEFGATP
jgi:hypothetical protein